VERWAVFQFSSALLGPFRSTNKKNLSFMLLKAKSTEELLAVPEFPSVVTAVQFLASG